MATMTSNVLAGRRVAPRRSKTAIKTFTTKGPAPLTRLPLLWLQRRSWRAELKALDAAQLRDCGLDPDAVAREAMKPFWRD
jgi:uncharacterized protein YjiS (DUF1127 family)